MGVHSSKDRRNKCHVLRYFGLGLRPMLGISENDHHNPLGRMILSFGYFSVCKYLYDRPTTFPSKYHSGPHGAIFLTALAICYSI